MKFLQFYRKVLMIPLTILVTAAVMASHMIWLFRTKAADVYTQLCNSADIYCQSEKLTEQYVQQYNAFQSRILKARMPVTAMELSGKENIQEELDALNAGGEEAYYILRQDGTLLSSPKKAPLELNDDEMENLLGSRSLLTDGKVRYYAQKTGTDTLIVRREYDDDPEEIQDALFIPSQDMLWYDKETHEITFCTRDYTAADALEGTNVDDLSRTDLFWKIENPRADMEAFLFRPSGGAAGWLNLQFAVKLAGGDEESETEDFYVFAPLSTILLSVLVYSMLPFLMLVLFAFVSLRTLAWMKKDRQEKLTLFHLGKRFALDMSVESVVLFTQIFVCVTLIICTVFMQSISHFSEMYGNADEDVKTFIDVMNSNKLVVDHLQEDFQSSLLESASECADYLKKSPDADRTAFLLEMKEAVGAEEITVYDENGVIQATTSEYAGYKLSQSEEDPESQVWKLMTGGKESLIFEAGESSDLYGCAVRRKDAVGAVLVKMSAADFRKLQEAFDFRNALFNTGFANFDKLYATRKDPSVLYRIRNESQTAEEFSSSLPVPETLQSTAGLFQVGEEFEFVYGMGGEEYILFSAEPVSHIMSEIIPLFWEMLLACLLISLLTLPESMVFPESENVQDMDAASIRQKMKEYELKILSNFGKAVYLVIAVKLVLDYVLCKKPIVSFLLFGSWQKGLNFFSLSLNLLAFFAAIAVCWLLRKLFAALSSRLPSHVSTIFHMVNSILNVLIWGWLILFVLTHFGVDTTAIFAGVSITGLAIGVGAQKTVNDLIAGIFIILDGSIRVGDTISVNGFEGEVTSIGIRSTVISRLGKEFRINNSSMGSVTNYSHGTTLFYIPFNVSINTDLKRLRKIIEDNQDRLQKAGRGLLAGDAVFSVYSFNGAAVVCEIFMRAEERYIFFIKFTIATELGEILQENGIQLISDRGTKAQVEILNADEK